MKHLIICLIVFSCSVLNAQSSNSRDQAIGITMKSISEPFIEDSKKTYIGIEYLRLLTDRTNLRAQLSLVSESSLNLSRGSIGLMYGIVRSQQFSVYGALDFNVQRAFDENILNQNLYYSASTGLGLSYDPSRRFSMYAEQQLINAPFNVEQKVKFLDGFQFGFRYRF